MKQLITILLALLNLGIYCQIQRIDPHMGDQIKTGFHRDWSITNDTTYDVNFYHIDIEIAVDSSYISGNVHFGISSLIEGFNTLRLDLDNAFSIDSIAGPVSNYSFTNRVVTVNLNSTYNTGEAVSFTVYYHGAAVMAGGYKGLRYETHDGDEPIIATLSTPYLAHTWWPCKDGTGDKADSTFIDITIKDTVISSVPVVAISNGILETVETNAGKKTFKWRHKYPAVPYYIMAAISNYVHFQQNYSDTSSNFPIDYYVFASHLATAQQGVADLPDAMGFFSEKYGPYPFREEKYGMTQLGFYGAIENQTNTIQNSLGTNWFYVSVHELAHMWFADMITCDTWHHGWVNEGFASYSEALYNEHVNGFSSYKDYMVDFEYYDPGTLYMYDVSDPFSVFQPIIYRKGAYFLHMLRGVLGDSTFFDAVYNYASDSSFIYGLATTEDFQTVCENTSGQDLEYFFDQWIYDEFYPVYEYYYEQNQASGMLEIMIQQTQGNNG